MAGIRLEWSQHGAFDSFNIYKSDSAIDIYRLPTPLATDLTKMYYVDNDVVELAYYHYRIGVIRDNELLVSDEKIVQAVLYSKPINIQSVYFFDFGKPYKLFGIYTA